jgi:glutamine synthetase
MTDGPGAARLSLSDLEREVSRGAIHTVITALPDLYGRLIGKRINGRFFLQEIAAEGMHVCDYLLACDMEMDPTPGYAFASWDTGYGDLHAVPDLTTLRRAAWLEGTAIVLCDAHDRDGGLLAVSPRSILRAQIARAAAKGLHPYMASELEFFLLADDYATAHAKGYRGLTPSQRYVEDYHVLSGSFAEPVIGEIRRAVDASGIPVEFSKGEWGPGQHEINLRYARALEMADRHVIYKLAAKEVAAAAGTSITFMAKFDEALAGSSLHVHSSLWNEQSEPLFPGRHEISGTPVRCSETFMGWLAGQLAHVRELSPLIAPNPNSYKRYRPGTFAPTAIAWSYDNRTAGFRIVGRGGGLRVECRIPGADANPYLVYAALIAAGLDGIERGLDPGPAFQGDAYAAEGLPQVPRNFQEALAELEGSDFARQAFGPEVVDHLLHFGRTELAELDTRVSDVERARYYERI